MNTSSLWAYHGIQIGKQGVTTPLAQSTVFQASVFALMPLHLRCSPCLSANADAQPREWSLLIPAYGMTLVLLTYVAYFALSLAGTPSFSDMSTITGA